MDNYDKARKVLQSTALSKIAQQTGISIGRFGIIVIVTKALKRHQRPM